MRDIEERRREKAGQWDARDRKRDGKERQSQTPDQEQQSVTKDWAENWIFGRTERTVTDTGISLFDTLSLLFHFPPFCGEDVCHWDRERERKRREG